jgi:hypothetical protein
MDRAHISPRRISIALTLACAMTLPTLPAHADSETLTGTAGAAGGSNGEAGGAGADATLTVNTPDPTNNADAKGGAGGAGANGTPVNSGDPGSPGPGGAGGNGGNATATAITNTTTGPATATAGATAGAGGRGALGGLNGNTQTYGPAGSGGNGGNAVASAAASASDGSPVTVSVGAGAGDGNFPSNNFSNGGLGGNGGNAVVSATASNTGDGYIQVTASAQGGNSGGVGGAAGVPSVFAPISATSTGGANINVSLSLYAGWGGEVPALPSGVTVPTVGDDGAIANATNDITASTTGRISLTQSATGGNAGTSGAGVAPGHGGDAISNLSLSQNGPSNVTAFLYATGGNGTYGGNATASLVLSGDGDRYGYVTATGGTGPSNATATCYLTSTSSQAGIVSSNVTAIADYGFSAYDGEPGGTAIAQATGNNASNGEIVMSTIVTAGGGGSATTPGQTAGAGGQALLAGPNTGISTGGGSIYITAVIRGGSGGLGIDANGGNGASESITNGVAGSTTGSINLQQTVYGGYGGNSNGGLSAGSGGNATSILAQNFVGESNISLQSTAIAGLAGGFNSPMPSFVFTGKSGVALSQITVSANAPVTASSIATGGGGGTNDYDFAAGGDATSNVSLSTIGDVAPRPSSGLFSATSKATAGAGGSFYSSAIGAGSAGGNATASASAAISGVVNAFVTAQATGGGGGSSIGPYAGSKGGNALACGTAVVPYSSLIIGNARYYILSNTTASAKGGAGGSTTSGHGGNGGDAVAIVNLSSASTAFSASARSGAGGVGTTGNGLSGSATAILNFNTLTISQFMPPTIDTNGSFANISATGSAPTAPYMFSAAPYTGSNASLSLSGTGATAISSFLNIGSLSLANNTSLTITSPSVASTLTALTLNGNAALTLSNTTLIEEPLPATRALQLQALQSQVITGRTSSQGILPLGLLANFTLAVIDNSLLAKPLTTLGGATLDSNAIFITPERLGDTNLDGTITLTDLNTILSHLGQTTPNWTSGNFDGAPTIDLTDLNDVLNHLPRSLPTPEPASLALLACAAPLLIRRSRRR